MLTLTGTMAAFRLASQTAEERRMRSNRRIRSEVKAEAPRVPAVAVAR